MKVCSMDGMPIDPSPDFPAYLVQPTRNWSQSPLVVDDATKTFAFTNTKFNVGAEVHVFTRTEVKIQETSDEMFNVGDQVLHLIYDRPKQTSDDKLAFSHTVARILAAPAGQDTPESLNLSVFSNKRSAHAFTARWFMDTGFFILENAYPDNNHPEVIKSFADLEADPTTPSEAASTQTENANTEKLEV